MNGCTGKQLTIMVVAVCVAAVMAPVAVYAATGTLVNLTDPVNSAYKARVNSAGGAWTTMVDPATKSQAKVVAGRLNVGDTSGALTVDGKVDVANVVPRAPFAKQFSWRSDDPSQVQPELTVPAGKTLVIEAVTAWLSLPRGEQPLKVVVSVTTGAETVSHALQFLYQATDYADDEFVATHSLRLYAGPGSTLSFGTNKNGSGIYWRARYSVSGYLV